MIASNHQPRTMKLTWRKILFEEITIFAGFSGFSVKVSLHLQVTEHSFTLAVLNLPLEPGLADTGKVKVISVLFLRIVIIRHRVI